MQPLTFFCVLLCGITIGLNVAHMRIAHVRGLPAYWRAIILSTILSMGSVVLSLMDSSS